MATYGFKPLVREKKKKDEEDEEQQDGQMLQDGASEQGPVDVPPPPPGNPVYDGQAFGFGGGTFGQKGGSLPGGSSGGLTSPAGRIPEGGAQSGPSLEERREWDNSQDWAHQMDGGGSSPAVQIAATSSPQEPGGPTPQPQDQGYVNVGDRHMIEHDASDFGVSPQDQWDPGDAYQPQDPGFGFDEPSMPDGSPRYSGGGGGAVHQYARDWMSAPTRWDSDLVDQGVESIMNEMARVRRRGMQAAEADQTRRGIFGSTMGQELSRDTRALYDEQEQRQQFELMREMANTYAQDRMAAGSLGLDSARLREDARQANQLANIRSRGLDLDKYGMDLDAFVQGRRLAQDDRQFAARNALDRRALELEKMGLDRDDAFRQAQLELERDRFGFERDFRRDELDLRRDEFDFERDFRRDEFDWRKEGRGWDADQNRKDRLLTILRDMGFSGFDELPPGLLEAIGVNFGPDPSEKDWIDEGSDNEDTDRPRSGNTTNFGF